MDAVTYPAKDVASFVSNYLIPLRINVKEGPTQERYHYIWTPTMIVLDLNGNEIQRTIGFFEPDEFIASMHLGIAKTRLNGAEYDTALVHLKNLLEHFPNSSAVAEAIYFRGVTLYKQNNAPNNLKEAYEKLQGEHPDNAWTKRAYPYRLI